MDKKEKKAEALVKYREINETISKLHSNDEPVRLQNFIQENLETIQRLYPIIKKNLDGTRLDSKVINDICKLAFQCSKQINKTSRTVDTRNLISRLKRIVEEESRKKGNGKFYKYVAKNHIRRWLCSAPATEFIYGTLNLETLEPKQRIIRKREKHIEKPTTTSKQKNMEVGVQQDTTPQEVEHLYTKLNNAVKQTGSVPFFQTLADPQSFSKTVENIFHASFLIKEEKIGIKNDQDKKPVLYVEKEPETDNPRAIQSILSFSIADYKEWVKETDT